ncbi:hypothetical protein AAVH_24289 [Aphelenchoides avenae]|nr:hypothetical protein AAVH_24289 [Aphelenchus avenae]
MEQVPGNAVARANPTLIPNETLLMILRRLHRFDLDIVQISSKRLRNLVENSEMPLRYLDKVTYIGDAGAEGARNVLILEPKGQQKQQCLLDVEDGIDMARRFLTTTCIRILVVSDHDAALPKPQLLTAQEKLIKYLSFERCNFNVGEDNALEKTLFGCCFGQLFIQTSKLPGWQLNDALLYKICYSGCALMDFSGNAPLTANEKYAVTNEGILDYCFSSDVGIMKARGRTLAVTEASITPALAKKCIQASMESKVTGRVQLVITNLRFEHLLSADLAEFDENLVDASAHFCQFDFPDNGNGARLQIKFSRGPQGYWMLQMRRGNKDDKALFDAAWPGSF